MSDNKIVFLDPNDINEIPFTTSEVIAEHGDVSHKVVTNLINRYKDDLQEFGEVHFNNAFNPNTSRNYFVYHLNEEQATLLITYMQNTLPVRKFKKMLVKQFYLMQKELTKRVATREIGKHAREALTNAIQALPESPHKSMKYKHYTDLIYKIIFGKNAKQLRDEYGMTTKDNLRDRFTADENQKIEKLESQIGAMIELGYEYNTIKDALTKKYLQTA